MNIWKFVAAGLFLFLALVALTVSVNIAAEYRHAQILVAPEFGQLADQAWDSWRGSVLNLFSFFSF